ncbi:MAG: hypothetical protein QM765_35580 [Myxococcales bacterium]
MQSTYGSPSLLTPSLHIASVFSRVAQSPRPAHVPVQPQLARPQQSKSAQSTYGSPSLLIPSLHRASVFSRQAPRPAHTPEHPHFARPQQSKSAQSTYASPSLLSPSLHSASVFSAVRAWAREAVSTGDASEVQAPSASAMPRPQT